MAAIPVEQVVTAQQSAPAPPDPAEFPRFDSAAAHLASQKASVKALAQRVREAPDDAELPRRLAEARRFDDLLVSLRRIIETHPERIAQAFRFTLPSLSSDHQRNYPEAMLALTALARRRLTELPRESAAASARVLLDVEMQLDPERSRNRFPRLEAFVEAYSGTGTALLAEVDLLEAAPFNQSRLDALEAFAREHPGTSAAAKALFQRGMNLAVNALGLRIERAGADPVARFTQVAAMARELQSGDYPRCEWTDRAADLIIQFSMFRPVFSSPDHIDTMLNAYRDLLHTELPKRPATLPAARSIS